MIEGPGPMPFPPSSLPMLAVEDLVKRYRVGTGRRGTSVIEALGGVSFSVPAGSTFGLVGESGCGKSTIARCIVRLTPPSSGRILFEGTDMVGLDRRELRAARRRLQLVFQDSGGSLDPRMRVGSIVAEPLALHGIGERRTRDDRAREALALVGLDASLAERKPHELSGGQRQRVGLARALVLDPSLIVLDEPVSALDVSVQAQVLNLLAEVQDRTNLTYLFIVHDLAVAEHFCDEIAVLYLGHVMEQAPAHELFARPLHPYTVALLSAVPVPVPPSPGAESKRIILTGEVTQRQSGERGCPFRPRCPVGRDRAVCAQEQPPLVPAANGQRVACHFPGEAL
jgi:oligopeptide/dipeptide ABC transporter ATP-binding protein